MNKVFILLDSSGSMGPNWSNTISGINEYISSLSDKQNTHVTLQDFRGVIKSDLAQEFGQISAVWPAGMTPLYDNIGSVYTKALEAGYAKTAIVVVTDGEENASHKVNQDEIKRMASVLRDKEWPLTFVGASFDDVVSVGAKAGVGRGSTFSYNSSDLKKTKGAFRDLGARTMAYASAVGGQSLSTFEYSEEERKQFGGT